MPLTLHTGPQMAETAEISTRAVLKQVSTVPTYFRGVAKFLARFCQLTLRLKQMLSVLDTFEMAEGSLAAETEVCFSLAPLSFLSSSSEMVLFFSFFFPALPLSTGSKTILAVDGVSGCGALQGERKIVAAYAEVSTSLLDILNEQGVTAVEALGVEFDPMLHEAVSRCACSPFLSFSLMIARSLPRFCTASLVFPLEILRSVVCECTC